MSDDKSQTTPCPRCDETDHLLASPANAERLRQPIAQITELESLPTRVVRLEKENKRLRAALGKIARRYPADTAKNMVRFARDTLGDGWRDA